MSFMRRVRGSLFSLIILSVLPGLAHAQESALTATSTPFVGGKEPAAFTFQKRVDEVSLVFTVVDTKGRFISKLKLEDFELLDDRRAPEKIGTFQQESDLPLRVALVVDISGSVTQRFKFEQESASKFLTKILRPTDKAMVVGFNTKTFLPQELTTDTAALGKAIHSLKPEGETALFDALVFASDILRRNSEPGTRRAIVLISDGENNKGHAILTDAEQAAIRSEAPIYVISTNEFRPGEYSKGEAVLDLLSRYTGGELLPARESSQVVRAFRQVEEALRSQYVMSYKPAEFLANGSYRPISLTARKAKLKVECRHGYFAPKD